MVKKQKGGPVFKGAFLEHCLHVGLTSSSLIVSAVPLTLPRWVTRICFFFTSLRFVLPLTCGLDRGSQTPSEQIYWDAVTKRPPNTMV
jgi:hypothetical protein